MVGRGGEVANIGVSMFVGGDDSVWLDASQLTEQTLKELGYTVELHVVAREGHIIAHSPSLTFSMPSNVSAPDPEGDQL